LGISSINLHGGDLEIFLIAWGLGASVIGVLMLVNFRGMRDRSTQGIGKPSPTLRRLPPWRWLPEPRGRRATAKWVPLMVAAVFTIVGPIVLVDGILRALRPGLVFDPMARAWSIPAPIAAIICGIAAVALWRQWRSYKTSRAAGGTPRHGPRVVLAIGTVLAAGGSATGYLLPALVGVFLCGGVQLLVVDREPTVETL
jgi:hypothetical protein